MALRCLLHQSNTAHGRAVVIYNPCRDTRLVMND
jgi:hypothetical protein